jgi:hypothetical protein
MARLVRKSGGHVFVEECYGALLGARGFEPPAVRITLDLRPAGMMFGMIFMFGSAAVAAMRTADNRVGQKRDAPVAF